MAKMQCEVCGLGPLDSVSVYRTGGKGPGIDPHWRCERHAGEIDPVVWGAVARLEHAAIEAAGGKES